MSLSTNIASQPWAVGQTYEDTPVELVPQFQAAQYAAHDSRRLRTVAYRLHYLKQVGYLLQDNADAICEAVKADLGRGKLEVMFTEVWSLKSEVELALKRLEEWMAPESGKRDTPMALGSYNPTVRKEPKGPALIISPWNYPFLLTFSPVIGAIAAGCPFLVKPSEHGKHSSLLVAQLIQRYLDPAAHQVIIGEAQIATALLDLKWGHVFFTGSTTIGKKVAVACAKNLVPYTLELGGKSPVIIAPDANLKLAARRVLSAKNLGAGQMCTNADYVLVPRQLLSEWMAACELVLKEFYGPDPANSEHISTMIHSAGYDRASGMLEKARASGKKVIGGQANEDRQVKRISTAVVLMDGDLKGEVLMEQEIFGPILPVVPVDDVDAAIAFVNTRPSPLALYVFSAKSSTFDYVLDRTLSGGACFNDVAMQTNQRGIPFGGVGESGTGGIHGKMSFDTFTHRRSTVGIPTWMELLISYRYPPTTSTGFNIFKLTLGPKLSFSRSASVEAESKRIAAGKTFRKVAVLIVALSVLFVRKSIVGFLIRGLSRLP